MPSLLKLKDRIFYGWVMVVIFLIVGTDVLGIRLSFGVFFKSIESEFELTRATTSAIFSAYMLLGCIFSFLAGLALDRYGPKIVLLIMGLFTCLSLLLTSQTHSLWQLFITYSLLLSVGTAPMVIISMATISRWFNKKRGWALGIAGLGGSFGIIVMAPFATLLISNFNWRVAFIVLGATTLLVVIPLSRLLKKEPHEIGELPDGIKSDSLGLKTEELKKEALKQLSGLSLLQAFRTRSFWLLMLIALLNAYCVFLVFTHLVPHVTDMGYSAEEAVTAMSLMGVIGIIGRVAWSAFLDRMSAKRAAVICSLLHVLALAVLILAQNLWTIYLFSLLWGLAFIAMGVIMTVLTVDVLGLRIIGTILGVQSVAFGIGAAIGPFIGGLIFDINQSYSLAFLVGAASMLAVALLIPLIRRETSTGIRDIA